MLQKAQPSQDPAQLGCTSELRSVDAADALAVSKSCHI